MFKVNFKTQLILIALCNVFLVTGIVSATPTRDCLRLPILHVITNAAQLREALNREVAALESLNNRDADSGHGSFS